MKKISLFLTLLCMFTAGILKAETEPNDSKAQANTIALNAADVGTVSLTESDWFSVTTSEDGNLNIELTSSQFIYIQILDNDGITSLFNNYASGTITRTVNGLAAGTYYVRLYNFYGTDISNYTITASLTTTGLTNDVEFNGSVATASTLPLNGSVTGHVNYYYNNQRDTTDWYAVTVNQDGKLSYTIVSNGQNLYGQLYDGNGTTLLAGSYTTGTATYFEDGLAPGTYYIKISTYYNYEYIAYTLSNTLTPPVNANDPVANETYTAATVLGLNSSITGHIGFRYNGAVDVNDWYSVTTNANGELDFTITVDNLQNVYAELFDGDGTTELAGNYTTTTATYSEDGLAPGTYYIRVRTYYAYEFASYVLSNNLTEPIQSNDPAANETFGSATPFPLNSSITGHIGYAYNGADDLLDWYSVTTTNNGKISFSITSHNVQNVYAELFDGDGTTELAGNYTTTTASYEKDGLAPGTYYIRIRNYFDSEWAPYTLSNSILYPVQSNDTEPNGTFATGVPHTPGSTVEGHIGYEYNGNDDLEDWYTVTLPVDGKFSWTITTINSQNVYARLYDSNGTTLIGGSYTTSTASYTENNLAAGVYYIRVNNYYTTEFAPYTLGTVLEPMNWAAENPAPNNFAITPTLLPANTPSTGHINFYNSGITDTRDWWIIGYDGPGTMTITGELEQNHFNTSYPSIAYAIYSDTSASAIASGTWTLPSTNVNLTSLAVGKYYVRLTQSAGTFGAYRLTATYTENCANVVAIDASAQSIPCEGSISYTVSNGLADYTVQLYKDGSPYGAAQTTAASVSYSNLPLGTYYLRAFSFGASGTCNNVSGNTVFAAPAIPVITPGGATTFCVGQSVTLTSSVADSYLWSTGETTQAIVVSTAGSYSVTVYNAALCSNVSASTDVFVNPLPTPSIAPSGSLTFCAGGSVDLDAGTYASYLWSNGSTTQSINVSISGTFTVTVTDGNGCTGTSASVTTAVGSSLSPVITPSGSLTFCAGGSVDLDAGTYASYLWSNGSTIQSINVSTSGTFTVTVSDANGCTGTSASVTTTVGSSLSPVITPSGSLTFCAGGSVDLDAGTYASYLWSNGSTTQSINVSTSGTFTVTVTDGNGCSGTSASVTTAVGSSLSPVITPSGSLTFCAGGSVDLDAGSYASYLWSNGSTTQSINVSTSGTFTVTVTDGNGCSGTSASVTTAVGSSLSPVITPSGSLTFCAGGSVDLDAGVYASYLWSDLSTSQTINVSSSGSYSVTVTDANGCSGTSATVSVQVNPLPTVTLGSYSNVCVADAAITLTEGSPAGGTYTGTGVSGGTFDPAVAGIGTHVITYDYTDGNGCSNSASSSITVTTCGCIPPDAPVAVSGYLVVCAGQNNVTYTVPSDPNVVTYNWTLPNGMSGSSTTNSITVSVLGNFVSSSICVNTENACGQSLNTCLVVAKATAKPAKPSVITGPTFVCNGSLQTFSVVQSNNATSYNWTVPSGATIQSGQGTNTIEVTFGTITSGSKVQVTASNCLGTSGVQKMSIYGQPLLPHPNFSSFPALGVCGNNTYTYSISVINGADTYNWEAPAGAVVSDGVNSGNPLTTSSTSVQITYPSGFVAGNITISANNICGTGATRSRAVRSTVATPNPISGPKFAVCGATSQVYSITPVNGASSYLWTVPAGAAIVGPDNGLSIEVDFAGNFTIGSICAYAVNVCGNSTPRCLTVQGRPGPAAPLTGPSPVCLSQSAVNYNAGTFVGATSYLWTANNGAIVTGSGTSVQVNFNNVYAATSTITVKGQNACGASDKSALIVTVDNCRIANQETRTSELLNLYPNPASENVKVEIISENEVVSNVTILDVTGRKFFVSEIMLTKGSNELNLEVSDFAKGYYLVRVANSIFNVEKKLVIQ